MPRLPEPGWYRRLSRSSLRVARASDRIPSLQLDPSEALRTAVGTLAEALAAADPQAVANESQRIADGVCRHFRVAPVRVKIARRRPHDASSELQGLYEGDEAGGPDQITLWMYTARRGQVVAYKTFLRTLLHELCHHLDYTRLGLAESLHTPGFYRRESSLYEALRDAGLTRTEAVPMNPGAPSGTQLTLEFSSPGHTERDRGELARRRDGARQRQRGARQVLGQTRPRPESPGNR